MNCLSMYYRILSISSFAFDPYGAETEAENLNKGKKILFVN
jgi:hypothetical protein